eukprot:6263484-Amphidinium_carterae.1
MEVLDELEQKSNTEFTQERFNELLAVKGQWLHKLSNQLRAILVWVCLEEPLGLVRNTPRTPQQGLEALRRLNDRFDPKPICVTGVGFQAIGVRSAGRTQRWME